VDPALQTSFAGVAWCHVPADQPVRLDKLVTVDGDDDRWNRPGEPTVYLATEPALALAELARHLEPGGTAEPVRRTLLGLKLDIGGLLDLRRDDVRAALQGPQEIEAFRDHEVAREVAARARTREQAGGLLVPSMAFLDEPGRANLVLFVDNLGGDFPALVGECVEAGSVMLESAAG
jgi:RES domain-containing protein